MKKLLCLFLTLALVLASAAAFADALPEGSLFKPGTYSGEAQGIFVPVKVMVQVSETEIETVLIDATGETPELGGIAAEKMAMSIMKAQTPNVDTVSGATVTSNAIIAAATQALEKAGTKTCQVEELVTYDFPYVMMNQVMKIVKDMSPRIVEQSFDNTCRMVLAIRKSEAQQLKDRLAKLSFG